GRITYHDDWTFDINGLMAAAALFRLRSPTAGWYIKTVTADGREVTDTPLDFTQGLTVKDLKVVLTQTRSDVSGSVLDTRGAKVLDCTIVVFAEDRAKWTPESRSTAATRPDQNGQFKFSGLPPGQYLAAAVEYL